MRRLIDIMKLSPVIIRLETEEAIVLPAVGGYHGGRGENAIGRYRTVIYDYNYARRLAVQRVIKIYEETGSLSIVASASNLSADAAMALKSVVLFHDDIGLASAGTSVITHDWERNTGAANLHRQISRDSILSAWQVDLFNSEGGLGLTAGVLTANRMFTSFAISSTEGSFIHLTISGDTASGAGGVELLPEASFTTDEVLLTAGQEAHSFLGLYMESVRKFNGIEVKHARLTGWADWYYYYGSNSQQTILDNVNALALRLPGYGIHYIQIDDGWQTLRNYAYYAPFDLTYTTSSGAPWEANEYFKEGMKHLAEQIHHKGYKAGIWIRPYSIMSSAGEYKLQLPWVLPYEAHEAAPDRATVDISQEQALQWLGKLFHKITFDWDYDFIKFDFITYDLLADKSFKIARGEIGEMRLQNRKLTSAQAYAHALKALRDNVKTGTYLLGCNCLIGSAIGQVDGIRISEDVCIDSWELTKRMLRSSAHSYYANGSLWQNDPDVVMVGDKLPIGQARFWASFVGLSGGMIILGDCIAELTEERLDILKRILPAYPGSARPLRLFMEAAPTIWDLHVSKAFGDWHAVGLFNWEDEPQSLGFAFAELGLDVTCSYALYDFWEQSYLGPFSHRFSAVLPANTCKVVSVRELKPYPQLLSMLNHVTQGGMELLEESWLPDECTLKLRTRGIANSRLQCVISQPQGYAISSATGNAGLQAIQSGEAAFIIDFAVTPAGEDEWSIKFQPDEL